MEHSLNTRHTVSLKLKKKLIKTVIQNIFNYIRLLFTTELIYFFYVENKIVNFFIVLDVFL